MRCAVVSMTCGVEVQGKGEMGKVNGKRGWEREDAQVPDDRANVDDEPASSFRHVWNDGFGHSDEGERVRVECSLDFVEVQIDDRAWGCVGGVLRARAAVMEQWTTHLCRLHLRC